MTRRLGIDTSVLVRLVTGDPTDIYEHCVQELTKLVEQGDEVFASNQVIGEAYIAIQHHYGIDKDSVRAGLANALRSGLVSPLNGRAIIDLLESSGGAGAIDRLITDDYAHQDLPVLTLDQRMASLKGARGL